MLSQLCSVEERNIMLGETLKKCATVCYKLQFKNLPQFRWCKQRVLNVAIVVKNSTGMTLISPKV